MLNLLLLLLSMAIIMCGCTGRTNGDREAIFEAWPQPIEVRVAPGAFSRTPQERKIEIQGLAGEVLSAQVAARCNQHLVGLRGEILEFSSEDGRKIPASAARVRYSAFLPVDETLAMTADPLLEVGSVNLEANLAKAVWLTIEVPRQAEPGMYSSTLTLSAGSNRMAVFDLELEVLPAVLPPPPEWSFYLNFWQYPSGVARAHRVEIWSEAHWELLEKYAANFAAHGMNSIMTSVVYDPWKSSCGYPFDTMVEWRYPGEFEDGAADKFSWDFTVFDRYVELMMAAGVRDKIDCYAMVMGPGSTTDAHIRYLDTTAGEYRTAELTAGEPMWRQAWAAFLPVLRKHLKEKGWFEKAVLGFDEKPREVMQVIFDFILEEAPDFKIALSGGFPGDERKWGDEIVLPINDLTDESRWAEMEPLVKRMHADPSRRISFYTCCWPDGPPNNFLYSPLRESRLLPWLAWKFGFDGYTRWAVNAFPEDVWKQPCYEYHSGDMFFVYPGPGGPLDGMRWEVLRQGIQDYEALRIAWSMAEQAGRKDLLDKLKRATEKGTMILSCRIHPFVAEARAMVNEVIAELGGKG